MPMCGGVGQVRDADKGAQDVCDLVRGDVEKQVGKPLSQYTAHKVSTQLVAGTNFFIKIHIGREEYIHVRIYQPLPGQGEIQLHSMQQGKTVEDELTYF